MTAATLWIEIIIAGFVYVVGICFLLAGAWSVADVCVLALAEEFLPYLAAAAVAASYIVGIVAHRIVPVITSPILGKISKIRVLAWIERLTYQEDVSLVRV
jgi:hypothetical protein